MGLIYYAVPCIRCRMTNIEWIRTQLFGISQKEMAEIVGTTQASLSRVEAGETGLRHGQLQKIRSAAIERFGDLWSDRFLFDPVESLASPSKEVE